MSKKILTVLAPVVAMVAFMAVPSLAQATQTVEFQCGSPAGECPNGTAIQGQATLKIITQEQPETEAKGEITCPTITFQGTLTQNQGTHATGSITANDIPQNCKANGLENHFATNVGAGASAWTLQAQQPDEVTGKFQVHLTPPAGGTIQLTQQPQFFGSVTTCDYSTTSIQFSGSVQSDVLTVEGEHQFMRQSGSTAVCQQWGTLSGTIQFEDANKNPVVIHH